MFKKFTKLATVGILSLSIFIGGSVQDVQASNKLHIDNRISEQTHKLRQLPNNLLFNRSYDSFLTNYGVNKYSTYYNFAKPDVKVFNGKTFKNPQNYTDLEKLNIKYVTEAYYSHFKQLEDMGVNTNNIQDFQIVIDTSNRTYSTGGYYVYTSEYHTVNRNNFDKNSVVLYLNLANNSKMKNHITKTFIHEFGHHIGFSKYHYNFDYSNYKSIVGYKDFVTNDAVYHYNSFWRSQIYEQFAETYTELFINNYENMSAVPTMNINKKKALKRDLVKVLNK